MGEEDGNKAAEEFGDSECVVRSQGQDAVEPGPEEKKDQKAGNLQRRVSNFRRHARRQTSKAFPTIVEKLITEAKEGSLGHTKFLFDVAGVMAEIKQEIKKRAKAPVQGKSRFLAMMESSFASKPEAQERCGPVERQPQSSSPAKDEQGER